MWNKNGHKINERERERGMSRIEVPSARQPAHYAINLLVVNC